MNTKSVSVNARASLYMPKKGIVFLAKGVFYTELSIGDLSSRKIKRTDTVLSLV